MNLPKDLPKTQRVIHLTAGRVVIENADWPYLAAVHARGRFGGTPNGRATLLDSPDLTVYIEWHPGHGEGHVLVRRCRGSGMCLVYGRNPGGVYRGELVSTLSEVAAAARRVWGDLQEFELRTAADECVDLLPPVHI